MPGQYLRKVYMVSNNSLFKKKNHTICKKTEEIAVWTRVDAVEEQLGGSASPLNHTDSQISLLKLHIFIEINSLAVLE